MRGAKGALRSRRRGGPCYPAGMARALVIAGLVLVAAGLLWPFLGRLGAGRLLGRLPGDFLVQRGGFTFTAPLATSLLVSVLLSLVLWLLNR